MARYKAIITYDGTNFSGMQRQLNIRTIQGEFEKSLRTIGWQGASLLAAGRTDAGVHAKGQCVSFDMHWKHSDGDLSNAINSALPDDIAVTSIATANDDFHPRYGAISRTYTFQIDCEPYPNPLKNRYYWRVWPKPELMIMQKAAQKLVGEHDFSSYGTPPKKGGSTIRKVYQAVWTKDNQTQCFTIEASGFLYHMVRRIVAQLVNIGLGELEIIEVERYLSTINKDMVQGLAPAKGLFLASVKYP